MSCAADAAAHQAYSAVRSQLFDPSWLVWQPWESIVGLIDGHEDWKRRFVTRYLDFSPIAHLLARDDPRAAVGPPPAST
jgi:hypothetical protein